MSSVIQSFEAIRFRLRWKSRPLNFNRDRHLISRSGRRTTREVKPLCFSVHDGIFVATAWKSCREFSPRRHFSGLIIWWAAAESISTEFKGGWRLHKHGNNVARVSMSQKREPFFSFSFSFSSLSLSFLFCFSYQRSLKVDTISDENRLQIRKEFRANSDIFCEKLFFESRITFDNGGLFDPSSPFYFCLNNVTFRKLRRAVRFRQKDLAVFLRILNNLWQWN